MMVGKLWTKEFDTLLAELQPILGGTIKAPAPIDPDVARAVPAKVWVYPSLTAHLAGRRIELILSEKAAGRMVDVSGAEDEFLHFSVSGDFGTSFSVTMEGVFTRFKKLLRIDWEFETGNSSFDAKFYLNPRDKDARVRLKEAAIQQTIDSLQPFVVVNVREGSLFLSRGIVTAGDIQPEPVQKTFKGLIALADLLS